MEFNYRGHKIVLQTLPPIEADESVGFIAVLGADFRTVTESHTVRAKGYAIFILKADNSPDSLLQVAKSQVPVSAPPTVLDLETCDLSMKPEPVTIVPKCMPQHVALKNFEKVQLFNLLVTDGPPVQTIPGTGMHPGSAFVSFYNGAVEVLDYSTPEHHFEKLHFQYRTLLAKQREQRGDATWEPSEIVPDLEELAFLRAYKTVMVKANELDWASLMLQMSREPGVKSQFFNKFNKSYQVQQRDLL